MNYRRRWGTQVWHSSPDCPNWPQSELEAEERDEIPATGELCPNCEQKVSNKRSGRAGPR